MRVLRREPDPDEGPVDTTPDTDTDDADATVRERPVARERVDRTPETETTTTRESEVVREHWSIADAIIAVVGAGLALVGAIALIRTGVDRTWFQPVERVAEADHTALLGAGELGAGVLLMLAAALRLRALTAILGLAGAIGGALMAIENAEVTRELAIEENWAWLLAGVGAFVVLVSLIPPRRRRVERLVES